MLSINMDDVIKVLNSIKSQLIGFGVVAVLLIAVMIACRKQSKSKNPCHRRRQGQRGECGIRYPAVREHCR